VLRELANPGLLLRRITPEIIQHVMAPIRKMELNKEQAEKVFETLRRTGWLIEEGGDHRSIRHRSDLRQACVPLIDDEEPKLARSLHALASAYYRDLLKRRTGEEERVEWAYHELAGGGDLAEVDRQWDEKIAAGVANALDELRGSGKTYL